MSDPRFPELASLTLNDLDVERERILGPVGNYSELTENELERLGAILGEMAKRTTPAAEKRKTSRAKRGKLDLFSLEATAGLFETDDESEEAAT